MKSATNKFVYSPARERGLLRSDYSRTGNSSPLLIMKVTLATENGVFKTDFVTNCYTNICFFKSTNQPHKINCLITLHVELKVLRAFHSLVHIKAHGSYIFLHVILHIRMCQIINSRTGDTDNPRHTLFSL